MMHFNAASLLGFLDLLLALAIPGLSIFAIVRQSPNDTLRLLLYIGQSLLSLVALPLTGLILIFQGWKLDPMMFFSFFLIHLLVIALIARDAILTLQDAANGK